MVDLSPSPVKTLHDRFGIFRYEEELVTRGVQSPAEQIAVIFWFVVNFLADSSEPPAPFDDQGFEWLRRQLNTALTRLLELGGTEVALLQASAQRGNLRFWNLDQQFAELLSYRCADAYTTAAAKLKSRGLAINWDELSDLVSQFVMRRLPRALRSFDPLKGNGHEKAWLTTVFYRFALQCVVSDRTNRVHLEALEGLPSEEVSPFALMERSDTAEMLADLKAAFKVLPLLEQRGLSLYFGLDGTERTLSEMGQELGLSEHLARSNVLRALARLCVSSGVRGRFDADEWQYLQYTLLDGMTPTNVARSMNLPYREVQRLGGKIGTKLRAGLRDRTVSQKRAQIGLERENTVVSTSVSIPQKSAERQMIRECLVSLTETPPLRRDEGERLEAKLGERWIYVDTIREIALESAVASELEAAGAPVGWLLIPDARPTTLTEERLRWLDEVEELAKRSWVSAELLWQFCQERPSVAAGFISDAEDDENIQPAMKIHHVLASIAHSLESRAPIEHVRDGRARLDIALHEEGAIAAWAADPDGVRFNLGQVLVHRAQRLGELNEDAINLLSEVFLRELFGSAITLPGFHRSEESDEERVCLDLLPRTKNNQASADILASALAVHR